MGDQSYLGWPFFEEGHRDLAARVEAWTRVQAASREAVEEADCDAAVQGYVRELGAAGLLRYAVPAPYGGVQERLDVRSLCLLREILARHSGLADVAFAMQGLGTGSISLFGSEALKRAYLPPVARGERIAAFAMSEESAGSDPAAMTTTATANGDDYVLNGRKTWISNGGIADHYVVFARTGEAPGAKGLSAFVVDAETPGFTVVERIALMAPHPIATLAFADCRVPKANLLGRAGEGFKVAMATLDVFRPTVAAAAVGFARRALDEALARIQVREVFGQPLAEFQLTQAKIAEMATAIDASALLVYRAAWAKDRAADRITREAAMAKWYATEAAQRVIDQALQLFGGLGVVSGTPVERLYREIRALRVYEGTSEIQQMIIAGQTLREFREGGTAGRA